MEKTIELNMHWCGNCGKLLTKKREDCATCEEFKEAGARYQDSLELVKELEQERQRKMTSQN